MHKPDPTRTRTADSGERPLADTGNRAVVAHFLAGDSSAAEAYLSFYSGSRSRFH